MKTKPFSVAARRLSRTLLGPLASGLVLLWPQLSPAAVTDLANVPIASVQSAAVKPNIMLLMDTSASMGATHMPDDLEVTTLDAQPIGYRSNQCNPLYYNPSQTYVLPKVVDLTDTTLPLKDADTPSFSAARYNYYDALDPSVVDLGSAFQAFDDKTRLGKGESTTEAARSDAPQPAYYYLYTGTATLNYKTSPCTDPLGTGATTGGTWTKVLIPVSAQANFAIWYTYYRTRMALVKSGIGLAFAGTDNKYRVGLISASPLAAGSPTDANVPPVTGSAVVADKYEPIGDFDAAQRQKVYDKLYAQKPGGASPMREGLARVGRHYSDYGAGIEGSGPLREDGINKGMPQDPVQYSCQRNFTIMTTDGYWNKSFETAGAVKMDGVTKVGQQDSPLTGTGITEYSPRPIFDGGTSGYSIEQKQTYDYQAIDCTSGNFIKTVTSHFRAVDQYLKRTQQQFRRSETLSFERTRTQKTVTTQKKDETQLREKVTHDLATVTHSTRRDTHSTLVQEKRSKVLTQVLQNDDQWTIKYEYRKMTDKTATKTIRTATKDVVQWEQVSNDGSTWNYVSACSALLAGTSGCRLSASSGINIPVDPDSCPAQAATVGNHWKLVTCSPITTTGPTAISPGSSCIGDNNDLKSSPLRRQTCTLITKISYVSPTVCSPVSTPTQIITCGGLQTPNLSAGPGSGSSVGTCTPASATGTNLIVPGDATETSNNYQLSCPLVVVSTPHVVDPSLCPVNAGPSAKTTTSMSGLSTTCTPSVSTTPVAYDCGGSCSAIPATSGNGWTATTYPITSTVASLVIRATCPSNSTSDSFSSPYTHTTCTLDSDNSYAVATASCTAGPSFNGGTGITTSCSTAAVSGPTTVATCTGGFNLPAAGDTTTCTTIVDSDQGVASCTYGSGSVVMGTSTYSCTLVPNLGQLVDSSNPCTPGTTFNPVTFVTTTCYAPVIVNSYVQKGTCAAVAAGPGVYTVVACPAPVTFIANGPVAPGTCTPGTIFNTGSAAGGYTEICTNTAVAWTQEPVGTSCPGTPTTPLNLGFGAGWTGVESTDGATQKKTTCAIFDDGGVSMTGTCIPGITSGGALTQKSCIKNVISVTAPGDACSDSNFPSGVNTYWQVCTHTSTTPTSVAAGLCSANGTADLASGYTTTTCTPDNDSWQKQSRYSTQSFKQLLSGAVPVGTPLLISSVGPTAWANEGACTSVLLLPKPVGVIPSEDAQTVGRAPIGITNTDVPLSGSSSTTACTAWPCIGTTAVTDTGSKNSLADVAQYYYVTDLRANRPNDLLPPDVAAGMPYESDRVMHQHMSTFVVGLGVSGTLAFTDDYRNPFNPLGDFPGIRTGAKSWPVWPTTAVEGSVNPLDFSKPESIDDFWHAAVNGRGAYFSAGTAYTLVKGIQGALEEINSSRGAGGGATSSTAAPTAADNTVFVPGFESGHWTGDLRAFVFDLSTDTVTTGTDTWSAQTELEAMVGATADTRKIVLRKAGATAMPGSVDLTYFLHGNLNGTQQGYFDASKVTSWSQFSSMTSLQKTNAAGANLVNFIRGQRGNEDFVPGDASKLYRSRVHVLGDIVGSQPIYVKAPTFSYGDAGYAAFKSGSAASRKKMVYAGANDGMLHAFYAPKSGDTNWADKGKEAWAYIPSQVLPELHKLADVQYSVNHRFYVDGTVTVGDVVEGGVWRTVLVGGFNAGGKGYYALDITDPDAPKSLWEFTVANDVNMGLSFGRPIISKLLDGTWVAMFTSGYNNANGNGYLYVVNAVTGVVIKTIATGAGSASDPSGLREINNWVNNVAFDNTTQRVYGGDLLGNVWRFDVNGSGGALKLATLKTSGGSPTAQPITTRVELAEIGGDPYVYVGTGRLLGTGDLPDTQQQSVYSFKDTGAAYLGGDVRPDLKPMTLTTHIPLLSGLPDLEHGTRNIACSGSPAQCAKKTGWVIDLPESGERMNIDFRAAKGTLAFVTNVPTSDLCSAGHSWLNYVSQVSGNELPPKTGEPPLAGVILDASSLAVGLGLVEVGSKLEAVGVSARARVAVREIPWATPAPVGKRISWREVVQ